MGPSPRTRRSMLVAAVVAAATAAIACGPPRADVADALRRYFDAVQLEDLDALFCLSAGAAGSADLGTEPDVRRDAFARWARSEFRAYMEGRDRGHVDLAESGIVLAKTFTLGKGTFYTVDRIEPAGKDALRATTPVRFAYGSIDISGLTPGTTFYLAGTPPGVIDRVVIPARPASEELEVLETVTLDWTLVREPAADGCPERWTVADVAIEPGSVTTSRVRWEF